MIHPTAIIHPKARVDSSVQIGPYSVIDADVEIGAGCVLGPHVHLTGNTVIGRNNIFHAGSVVGDAPQDLKYDQSPTRLHIGDNNVFREHCTVHRSNKMSHDTRVGSHNLLMANSHVAHNCQIGNHVIVANGALLAGHAILQDRAFISGNGLVHQFVRVGRQALMQGGSAISKDLPPYTVARGQNTICGLNIVGLQRAGVPAAERLELKKLYRILFRSRLPLREAVEQALTQVTSEPGRILLDFVMSSSRGLCADKSSGHGPNTLGDESED